jgi:hypothetical protein
LYNQLKVENKIPEQNENNLSTVVRQKNHTVELDVEGLTASNDGAVYYGERFHVENPNNIPGFDKLFEGQENGSDIMTTTLAWGRNPNGQIGFIRDDISGWMASFNPAELVQKKGGLFTLGNPAQINPKTELLEATKPEDIIMIRPKLFMANNYHSHKDGETSAIDNLTPELAQVSMSSEHQEQGLEAFGYIAEGAQTDSNTQVFLKLNTSIATKVRNLFSYYYKNRLGLQRTNTMVKVIKDRNTGTVINSTVKPTVDEYFGASMGGRKVGELVEKFDQAIQGGLQVHESDKKSLIESQDLETVKKSQELETYTVLELFFKFVGHLEKNGVETPEFFAVRSALKKVLYALCWYQTLFQQLVVQKAKEPKIYSFSHQPSQVTHAMQLGEIARQIVKSATTS